MSDISKIKINDTTYDIKDTTARSQAAALVTDKVDKSGDTVTGNLNVVYPAAFVHKNSNVVVTETPSNNTDLWQEAFKLKDANDFVYGYIRHIYNTTGPGIQIETTRVVNNENVYNGIQLRIKSDGTPVVSLSNSSAWCSALGLGDSGWITLNNSIQTYYRKIGPIVTVILPRRNISSGSFSLGTLPVGYRPKGQIIHWTNVNSWDYLQISADGSVAVANGSGGTTYVEGCLTYFAA